MRNVHPTPKPVITLCRTCRREPVRFGMTVCSGCSDRARIAANLAFLAGAAGSRT